MYQDIQYFVRSKIGVLNIAAVFIALVQRSCNTKYNNLRVTRLIHLPVSLCTKVH